jgi:phosphotriesterase-related protein
VPEVETVLGRVDTAELGPTYMHEHVFVLTSDVQQNYPGDWGSEEDRIDDAVGKLKALAGQGIRTIADPTVVGLGRYIPRIQRVAERVPELNIIVATGCYTYDQVPFYFLYRRPIRDPETGARGPDPMIDLFVRDITEGISGTGVRAAFLKCAIDHPGMTRGVGRVMRAVARAHRQTGAPITIHTHPATHAGLAVKQLMCDEEGVDPARIVLGHSGDSTDVEHLCELAGHGFILGMDRFGLNLETTFEARADTVVELCRRGFAGQMVLANDASCYLDWMDAGAAAAITQWHYLHIHREVLPYLRDHGVSEDQIDSMLVRTPRHYFENTSPY